MELSEEEEEAMEVSQPGSQLPEVSGTPCFVVMDSQLEEQETTGGNLESRQEKLEEGRAQRLRGLQHLSKGSPTVPGHSNPQAASNIGKQPEKEGMVSGHKLETEEGAPRSSEMETRVDIVTKADDDDDPVSSSQEDLFNPEEPINPEKAFNPEESTASKHDESAPSLSKDASSLLCTPSESVSCLRFSGIVLAHESSTSGSGSSINVILPTPDAYGTPPTCIPSTPSGPDTSNEELNVTVGQDDIVGDLPKTSLLKRKSTTTSEESEDAYGIPAWQQELNRQQREKEALAGTQDSWLEESARNHGQRSPPATVDSANPSSSLSEHASKSSSESVESWSVPQQQPLMTSTGEESSKQSTATGSRPPSATTVQKIEQTSQRPQSLPVHGDLDKARQAHESVEGGSHGKHSSLPDVGELGTRQTMLDIVKKDGTAVIAKSHVDVKSQRGSQTSKPNVEEERPVSTDSRQAHDEGDRDVEVKEASQSQGGDAAASQDWFLRLSPSQTQTQTQHSQSRREVSLGVSKSQRESTHDKVGEPEFAKQGPPHDVQVAEGTGRESRTGMTSAEVDRGESQRKTHISRQATPWHATPSDTGQTEDDVIVIPESEDAGVTVGERRAADADESKLGSDRQHGDSARVGSKSGVCVHPDGQGGDSVFVEGEEQWTGEGHSRLDQLGELDISNNSSSTAGFHLSMPKDGALLRPRSMTPDLMGRQGNQRPDRTPRHSTPIGDESEVVSVRTDTMADPVQVTESEAKTSDKLVVSAVMDLDSVENSEIPEFHLEGPLIRPHLLKDSALSPVKKQTSVFSRVQEAKKSSESGKKAAKQAHKSTDDPFSLPKSDSVHKRRKPEDEEVGEDKDNLPEAQDVEDSATIPYTHTEEAQSEHEIEQEKAKERLPRDDVDHDAAEKMSLDENGDDVEEKMDVSDGGEVASDGGRVGSEKSGVHKERSQEVRHQSLGSNQSGSSEVERRGQKGVNVRSGSSSAARSTSADVEQAGAISSADEMSILAEFIHSDSCSGAESATQQQQPKPRPKAPRTQSSESPRKHVTIVDTEEVGPPKSVVLPGRRDPYEFTDSQSNKTPTPMKTWTRKDSDCQIERRPVRNLAQASVSAPAQPAADDSTSRGVPGLDRGMSEPQSSSRTRSGKRKRPHEAGTGQEGEEEEGEGDSSRPGTTNQGRSPAAVACRTPRRKKRSSEGAGTQITDQSPSGQPVPWKVIKVKQIITTQRVQEVIVRGELLERKVLSEKVEEVIEKVEQEFLTPSPQSKSSSLTSGSLADISSLGSRTSSSVGSMQKSISITSVGAMQKSTSLSSISEGNNSSLVKTISLPGSEKGSPSVANVLPGGALTSPEADGKEAEFARPASASSGRATPGSPSGGMTTRRRRSPRARETEEESVESEGIPCAQPPKDDGLSPGPDVDENVAGQAEGVLLPRVATTDSSTCDTIILNSPPREHSDDAAPAQLSSDTALAQPFMVPGVRVYTRWLDGFFYPGTILSEEKSDRLKVSFDDGDVRVVSAKDLIIKDWLSVGQSVMAESKDGYSYPGLVMGYYRTEAGSDTGYVVETDSGETARYPRTKVILSKDQAAALMTSCTSSTGVSDISLENLVDGPRQRSRLRTVAGRGVSRTPSKLLTKTRSPRGAPSPAVTRSGGKRKLPPPKTADSGASPKKRVRQLLPTASASPDLSKQGAQLRRSPRKRIPPASPGKSTVAGPSTSSRSPSTPRTMEQLMGPLPSNAALFRGMAFLLTQGEVVRRPRALFDSSTSESETEESQDDTPFNKDYARRQIEAGGGVVLRDFDKSQRTRYKIYLVANTYCRTKKYFLALAVSMPCISHLWLRDCCRIDKVQNYRAYLLPAGESIETGGIVEWRGQRCVLSGLNVLVVSQYDQVQSTWRSILIAAGCSLVTRIPTHNERSRGGIPFECDVVVTDPTCPRHILHRAQQLAVPVVSVEWVMQSLINGQRMNYGGHPKFTWDFKEKLSK
ncbi:uncharacterized protein [Diadema antillarum]|uniref:uncharacterized protein n=1 Tax=Diadema antillarum TaxID=105358 RepID=UPI003A863FD9